MITLALTAGKLFLRGSLVATLRWLRFVELLSRRRYNGADRCPFKRMV